jgi:hypothetical protein
MPDDNKLHQLPQSLGTFPLYNVDAFRSRLPDHIAERSGIFFPMWQRGNHESSLSSPAESNCEFVCIEAMWFGFENMSQNSKYVIRINMGNINAISGLPIQELAGKQDYVVVPGQPWLDGVALEPGVARQFVAMPCKSFFKQQYGSSTTKETTVPVGGGYTVEGQITGNENFGGIQVEVIPSYQKVNMMMFSYESQDATRTHILEAQTPRDYKLEGGSKIAMVPNPPTFSRPPRIRDFYNEDEIVDGMQCLVLMVSQLPVW